MHGFFHHNKPVFHHPDVESPAMGEGFIRFYKDRIKRSWKTIFISTFIIGLFVHIYKFTNNFLRPIRLIRMIKIEI